MKKPTEMIRGWPMLQGELGRLSIWMNRQVIIASMSIKALGKKCAFTGTCD